MLRTCLTNQCALLPWFLSVLAAMWFAMNCFAAPVSDVSGSKHNLSVTGPGTVTATSESQICVFCHTPHKAENIPGAPLWNRKESGATYTPYASTSIDANDIASTPGGSSKLCLSCHDGTIAIGSVNVINGAENVTIGMQGVGVSGEIPAGSGVNTGFTRNLGVNLSNDHPISFTYDSTLATADRELRDPTIETHISTRTTGVKPLIPLESDKVQCISCHDPHIRDSDLQVNRKFLRLNRLQQSTPSGGSFSETNDIICLGCHDKLGQAWSQSAHASSAVADEIYTSAAASQREFPDNTRVWQAACLNCHDTHTVQGSRRLLREATDSITSPKSGGNSAIEETCYQCHSDDGSVLQNQGTASFPVPDIKTDFTTGNTHMPITTAGQNNASEVHDIEDADFLESQARLADRHAECTDCHNPHRVMKNRLFNGTGGTAAGTHQHAAGHTNIASGVLRGSWGVEPVYGSATFDPNNLPITYQQKLGDGGLGGGTAVSSAHVTREYQICLKCHSSYAYGSTPPTLGSTGGNTSFNTNSLTQYTDQAIEFQAPSGHKGETTTVDSGAHSNFSSNNHRSWHPVMDNTGRTTVVRDVDARIFQPPWDNSIDIGNQTMYCSDCHGSSTANNTVVPTGGEDGNPWGPHGSTNDFILKGPWDSSTGRGQQSGLCFKCHDYNAYANPNSDSRAAQFQSGFAVDGGRENGHILHAQLMIDKGNGRFRCNYCHTMVPHGFKNKALLVNLRDVGPEAGEAPGTLKDPPYSKGPYYNNAMVRITSFARSGEWTDADCSGKDYMRNNCENPP